MNGTSHLPLYSAQSEKKNLNNQSRCDAKSKILLGIAIFIFSLALIVGAFALALFLFPRSSAPAKMDMQLDGTTGSMVSSFALYNNNNNTSFIIRRVCYTACSTHIVLW